MRKIYGKTFSNTKSLSSKQLIEIVIKPVQNPFTTITDAIIDTTQTYLLKRDKS